MAAAHAARTIRSGAESDVPALTALYNHYVVHSIATFDLEPFTPEQRRTQWFAHYRDDGPHRLLVAVDDADAPLGYVTSSPLRPKAAYATSVETSVYLHPDATGAGIGAALYDALFAALADQDLHRAYAGIAVPNDASVALHRRCGFAPVGVYSQAGRKFGRYIDVAWFEKALGPE